MTLRITAAGQILRGTAFAPARIVGTSPRELRTDAGLRVDVTHAWGSHDLPAIVEALLDGSPMPAGYHLRARNDGVQMVGNDR